MKLALASLLLLGCSSAAPPAPAVPHEPAPASATELVQRLASIASGARPGSLDDYVDHAFAARLPSTDPLPGLFSGLPAGCTPELSEGPGETAIAIPPPMVDDTDGPRIQAIIDELQASTEVMASCEGRPVYAIAIHRVASGALAAMAWRNFRNEHGNE